MHVSCEPKTPLQRKPKKEKNTPNFLIFPKSIPLPARHQCTEPMRMLVIAKASIQILKPQQHDARPLRYSGNPELPLSASINRKRPLRNFPYFQYTKNRANSRQRGTLHVNPWDYVISSACGLLSSLARCCHRSTTSRSQGGIAMRNANYVLGYLTENQRLPRGQPACDCGPGHRGRHRGCPIGLG